MAKLARPDGYTVSQLPITAYRLPHQRQVDWDAINDFTYLIGITGYTFGVVVKADSPLKTFNDLIDYAKANPGKLAYGTPGTGTSPHLLMEEVGMKTGVQFLHVPFKGNADSMQALLAVTSWRSRIRPAGAVSWTPARSGCWSRSVRSARDGTRRPRRSSALTSFRIRRTAWWARKGWMRRS